jgi:hypothetical protein
LSFVPFAERCHTQAGNGALECEAGGYTNDTLKLPNSSIVSNFEQNSRHSTVHIPHEARARFVKLHPRLDHRVAAGKEYTKATFANL